jgi:hypothetical protein
MLKKYQIVPLLVAALSFCNGNASYSQRDGSEADQWKNWDIYITPKALAKYLDYPQSKLKPITRVAITYAQPPRVPLSVYEDLYYTTSQPIGCSRRVSPINITPGTAGIIHITAVNSPEDVYAASNSALRIFLDVSLHSCMTKYVQVPIAAFDGVVAALCNMGLHRHSQTSSESGIAVEIQADKGEHSVMLFQ